MKPIDETKHPKLYYCDVEAKSETRSGSVLTNDLVELCNNSTQKIIASATTKQLPPGYYTVEATTKEVDGKIVFDVDYSTAKPHPHATFSDPSHLDWKLSEAFTPPITMAEHRAANPKPPLFDLLHRWNLSQAQQNTLEFYKLHSMSAAQLEIHLRNNDSKVYHSDEPRMVFIPIYQNTTRQQIKYDATGGNYTKKYYLSFRSVGNTNIVLIQRSRND